MPKVLLTRPRQRSAASDEIHHILRDANVMIEELPMLRFDWPDNLSAVNLSLERAAHGEFEAIIFSSPTAVNFFEERARELDLLDAVRLNARFGAVGTATARELAQLDIETDFPVPVHGGSSELAAIMMANDLSAKRILLLQSQIGLDTLHYALTEIGAVPERVTLYLTEGPTLGDAARLVRLMESNAPPEVIAFFSPSAVQHFVRTLAEMASGLLRQLPALACIGETTAKAVEEAIHRRPEIIARKADQASLAEDIIRYLRL